MSVSTIDLTGIRCPVFMMNVRKALRSLTKGDRLEIIATYEGAFLDVRAFCRVSGDTLESHQLTDGKWRLVVVKG